VEKKSVQTFGKKKTATAVAFCKEGKGHIKVNGCPLALVEPEILRQKVFEPVRLLGEDRFKFVDIRIRVKGGGYVSQIYAIRQVSRWCGVVCTPLIRACSFARPSPRQLWPTIKSTSTSPPRRRSRRS
jgi:hypothetical protein